MIEFTQYPKTARLFKDGLSMVVTEKLAEGVQLVA